MTPLRLVLGAVGLAIGIVAVSALREATLSTHQPIDPDSEMEIVLSARTRGGEEGQNLTEMTEAQLLACRLEVSSDLVGPVEDLGDGRYRATLTPALDQTNRRQFRGCLEDWTIDHLLLDVVDLRDVS